MRFPPKGHSRVRFEPGQQYEWKQDGAAWTPNGTMAFYRGQRLVIIGPSEVVKGEADLEV